MTHSVTSRDELPPAQPVVAIVNGNASGIPDPGAMADSVRAALEAHGVRASATVTDDEGELHDALRAAAGGRAVLVGGDGSVHAAVNAPLDLPEVALVPTGRANNIARELGIPTDVEGAVEVAAQAPARRLDVLRLETPDGCMRCVEGVSAGLQAEAREKYDAENSGQTLAGIGALVRALVRYEPYDVELRLDGEQAFAGPAGQVFLSNLALFGFRFEVNPEARPADGQMEAIVLQAPTRRRALRMLARAYRGRHLETSQADCRRSVRAELRRALPLACDGVPIGTATATVRVESGLVHMAAPG